MLSQTDKEQFALIRRSGLGASDSSVVLGVNPFNTVDTLIEEKLTVGYTDKEKEISNKVNVRKGSDLEPLILEKFIAWSGIEVIKPQAMYKITECPWLTVNFDGIANLADTLVPIEIKFVSTYADRYWNRQLAIENIAGGSEKRVAGMSIEHHCELSAQAYGVPIYYYTQIQQQLLALNAPFGYMVALFDRDWEIRVYKIYADRLVQDNLIRTSKLVWEKIESRR